MLSSVSKLLSSTLFFLTVTVIGAFAGSKYLLDQDARDIAAGDKPHSFFRILVLNRAGRQEALPLTAWKDADKDKYSALLPEGDGIFLEPQKEKYSYSVQRLDETSRHVSISYLDDDGSAEWRYEVTDTEVVPVYSKVASNKYIFQALPYAFVLAFLLNLLGKIIGSLSERNSEQENDE